MNKQFKTQKKYNHQRNNGIPLANDNSRIERWTEYCKDLYNLKINPDCDKLQNDNHQSEMEQPLQILKSEV